MTVHTYLHLLNSIKADPIPDKTYFNLLGPDFYLDLHQIVLSQRYQPPKYALLFPSRSIVP